MGPNATEAIKNQNPPVTRKNLYDLIEAPIDWEKLENGIRGEQARISTRNLLPHQKEALEKTLAGRAYLDTLSIFRPPLIANPTGQV
jgi:predicted helicase